MGASGLWGSWAGAGAVDGQPLALGSACVFGLGGGLVAVGDEVFDLLGEAGDLGDRMALADEAEQQVFGLAAVGLIQAAYPAGDGGGVSGGQVAGGEAFGDLWQAGELGGEGGALLGTGVAHPECGA